MRSFYPKAKKYNGVTYRSGLEATIAKQLTEANVPFEYETMQFEWTSNVVKGECTECESTKVIQNHIYTPDFLLLDTNIIVEVKGRFLSKDRTKMKAVIKQHPDYDFRMLFSRDSKLSKGKSMKCSDWCKTNKMDYAINEVPKKWMT